MKIYSVLIFLLILFSCSFTFSQENFYDIDSIREIRIYFEESDWDHILDSLFEAGEQERLLGNLVVDGTPLDSCGIRYKGYSSVDVDRVKNPFNIKLDYVIPDQEYMGINKIKLSNVLHDPSFIRETMSYEIARKYMPASRANYANVYINDTLMGLYTNVEAVNKDFVDDHYGSRENSFFKGNPEELIYPYGSNANLQYYEDDTATYYTYYDIKSDYGWADLLDLIHTLNQEPENLDSILNIDRTLWMHAFNYTLVNLDSYIAYSQNYYLYQDDNSIFNPVSWDLNMSFGSFRFSDGSYGAFSGNVTIEQAKNLDPLQLLEFAVSPRPLVTNLLQTDIYKRMYIAHIRTIINENILSGEYYTRGQAIQTMIDADVQNDPNKFYSYDDFINNLTMTVGGTGDMIEYPGITDLMEDRTDYLSSYNGFQGAPVITDISNSPQEPEPGEEITITATITGATYTFIGYRYYFRDKFIKTEMFDDGAHNDGAAGDNIYGAKIIAGDNVTQYYIYAENDSAGAFSPLRAEYEYYTIQANLNEPGVVINEFMASNSTTVTDQDGEYNDWIELYNNSDSDFDLNGLYLSDNPLNIMKWPFPDTSIKANDFLIVWADEDGSQEGLHANFKLSATGEIIYLAVSENNILDSVTFGQQTTDVTTGRYPNGTGAFVQMPPTFSDYNTSYQIDEIINRPVMRLCPNPASEYVNIILFNMPEEQCEVELWDINGRIINKEQIFTDNSTFVLNMKITEYSKGIYIIKLKSKSYILNKKLIIN